MQQAAVGPLPQGGLPSACCKHGEAVAEIGEHVGRRVLRAHCPVLRGEEDGAEGGGGGAADYRERHGSWERVFIWVRVGGRVGRVDSGSIIFDEKRGKATPLPQERQPRRRRPGAW